MNRRLLVALWLAVLVTHATLALLEGGFFTGTGEPRRLVGDELRYLERAQALAAGEQIEPDLLWPPLYTHFLALTLRLDALLGLEGSRVAIVLAQLALLALCAGIGRDLAVRLAGLGLHADLAVVLILGFPPLAAFAYYLWPEILHLACFLGCLWILAARAEHRGWLALLGLLLGVALLTKSLLTFFVPLLLWPVAARRPWRRGVASALLVAGTCLAVVLPTVVSHERSTGSAVIADSSRFNLWLGLNDTERVEMGDRLVAREHAAFLASGATFAERNRVLGEKIRRLLAERGWVATVWGQLGKQYFRLLDHDSALTHQLPGGRLAQRGRGYAEVPAAIVWGLKAVSYVTYALILALAPLGCVLFAPRSAALAGGRWVWVALAFLGYNAAIFLLLHVKSRYAVQFLPLLMICAAGAAGALIRREGRAEIAQLSRFAAVAAVGAAGLLELLAFGAPAFF